MNLFLAMALKPILALILFGLLVRPLSYFLRDFIPEGKVKDRLYKRY